MDFKNLNTSKTMKPNKIAYITAAIFIVLAVMGIGSRIILQESQIPGWEKMSWRLYYDIDIYSLDSGAKAIFRIPSGTRFYRVVSESFSYNNLSVSFDNGKNQGGRRLVGVQLSKNNPSGFKAEIEIRRRNLKQPTVKLTSEERKYYLREAPRIQTNDPSIVYLAEQILSLKSKKKETIEAVFKYIDENIEKSPEMAMSDALTAVNDKKADTLGRARLMIALCRTLKIPARMVTGFNLSVTKNLKPHIWVEVYYKDSWNAFDPEYGYEWVVPAEYFPVGRNTAKLLTFNANYDADMKFSIKPFSPKSITVRSNEGLGQLFNLERLPIGMRNIVSIILLLPIGVLVTAVFRNLIGLQTFGTFAPSLLALSFVLSDWKTGLVILAIVMLIGYISRSFLDKMNLLMVPRIGLILTLVIMLMTMAISVFDYLNLTPSANAVLLPTVILATLIERIFITEIEDGTQQVFKLLMGTFLVAFTCFVVFSSSMLRMMIISFPEILFLVIAGLIFLGRYSGYRLIELKRFRDLVR